MEPDFAYTKLAFEFASDLAKQLITLSTAILALSITFQKDIAGKKDLPSIRLLGFGWIGYLLSILLGIWTLMALTGSLAPVDASPPPTGIDSNARLPAGLQILAFTAATILLILHAWTKLKGGRAPEANDHDLLRH